MTLLLVLAACLSQDRAAGVFEEQFEGYEACLIVQKVTGDYKQVYNSDRTEVRFSPCSTFKVSHTVFALDYGVVSPNELFEWDKLPKSRKTLERDHTLASAIQFSVISVFQEIAARIGEQRMKEALSQLNYGNQDISGGQTRFWLTSSLKISAREQVDIVTQLVGLEWPFSRSSQLWVKAHLLVEEGDGYRMFGKTGSGVLARGGQIGWWIGWVEVGEETYAFAGNYEGEDAMGHRMRPKVDTILRAMGVLPAA